MSSPKRILRAMVLGHTALHGSGIIAGTFAFSGTGGTLTDTVGLGG